jgi:hypothetical protein
MHSIKFTVNTEINHQPMKYDLLVTISEATKLLLTSSVPAIETDFTTVGTKIQRVNFNTDGGCNGKIMISDVLTKINVFPSQ